MSWIQTFTGRKFYPLEPRAADVCIEDIAHALALTCRFTGHCREFYSVAQHSVFCSEYVAAFDGSPALQLAALLHDASEAYLPDVARPIKSEVQVWVPRGKLTAPDLKEFSEVEDAIIRQVATALGLDIDLFSDPIIKEADIVMLMTEKRDLMGPSPEPWVLQPKMLWTTIYAQSPNQAEASFLNRYRRLQALCAEASIVTDGTAS